MQSVEFSFPEADPATANRLVQDLRRRLIQAGVPDDKLIARRTDPENMDGGMMLSVEWVSVAVQVIGIAATFAITCFDVATRNRQPIVVITPQGTATIKPGDTNFEAVSALLTETKDASGK